MTILDRQKGSIINFSNITNISLDKDLEIQFYFLNGLKHTTLYDNEVKRQCDFEEIITALKINKATISINK